MQNDLRHQRELARWSFARAYFAGSLDDLIDGGEERGADDHLEDEEQRRYVGSEALHQQTGQNRGPAP